MEEIAQARGVNHIALFNQASNLFTGQALIWFSMIRKNIRYWAQLVLRLISAFLPLNYDNRLCEKIENGLQGLLKNRDFYYSNGKFLCT